MRGQRLDAYQKGTATGDTPAPPEPRRSLLLADSRKTRPVKCPMREC
jgi:hypothetical protein